MRDFLIKNIMLLTVIDNEKIIEYIDFCINNNLHHHIPGATELHHILPKSKSLPFTRFENLSANKWNGVYLSYENHYIAHKMLALAASDDAVVYAWWNLSTINKSNEFKKISKEEYKNLRERHSSIVSKAQTQRNKDPNVILKRKKTMSTLDENGNSKFKIQGQKISKTLKERGSARGENNPMFKKVPIKERNNPNNRFCVSSEEEYDKTKYVGSNCKYLKMFDNFGTLYFHGYTDECIEYCNSIGLQGNKICPRPGKCFVYNENLPHVKYLVSVMKLAGLERYLNSTIEVIKSNEEIIKLKEAESTNES